MTDIIAYIKAQPLHILLLYVAAAIAAYLLFIVITELVKRQLRKLFKKSASRPSRSKSSSSNSKNKSNLGLPFFKKGTSSSAKNGGFFKSKKADSVSKMRSRSINGYNYSSSQSDKLSDKLDFLSSQDECITKFKHGKVTPYFKELCKAGPASNLKEPDIDDLDKTFTAMLKAGAVKKKPFLVTDFEHQYLEKLRLWFADRYEIYCQVSVGSALGINADVSSLPLQDRRTFAQKCHNMSFDFMLIEKGTDRIACVVELDDPTHLRGDRKARDRRLDKVCAAAKLPIFHITALNQKPDLRSI